VESQDDRIAKRLAEIQQQDEALRRESAERRAAAPDPGAGVVARQPGGAMRSAGFLISVVLLAAGMLGVAVTFTRLAGKDIADAKRTGQAAVTSCDQRGPVSNRGFGYWDSCVATITWDDGQVSRATVGGVFTKADVGNTVRVGDLGRYRTGDQLARADLTPRPWLAWLGYLIAVLAFLPAIIAIFLIRELLRFRRR
jgi:hypothetical protein